MSGMSEGKISLSSWRQTDEKKTPADSGFWMKLDSAREPQASKLNLCIIYITMFLILLSPFIFNG